jgi:hypothetical protein
MRGVSANVWSTLSERSRSCLLASSWTGAASSCWRMPNAARRRLIRELPITAVKASSHPASKASRPDGPDGHNATGPPERAYAVTFTFTSRYVTRSRLSTGPVVGAGEFTPVTPRATIRLVS